MLLLLDLFKCLVQFAIYESTYTVNVACCLFRKKILKSTRNWPHQLESRWTVWTTKNRSIKDMWVNPSDRFCSHRAFYAGFETLASGWSGFLPYTTHLNISVNISYSTTNKDLHRAIGVNIGILHILSHISEKNSDFICTPSHRAHHL